VIHLFWIQNGTKNNKNSLFHNNVIALTVNLWIPGLPVQKIQILPTNSYLKKIFNLKILRKILETL